MDLLPVFRPGLFRGRHGAPWAMVHHELRSRDEQEEAPQKEIAPRDVQIGAEVLLPSN